MTTKSKEAAPVLTATERKELAKAVSQLRTIQRARDALTPEATRSRAKELGSQISADPGSDPSALAAKMNEFLMLRDRASEAGQAAASRLRSCLKEALSKRAAPIHAILKPVADRMTEDVERQADEVECAHHEQERALGVPESECSAACALRSRAADLRGRVTNTNNLKTALGELGMADLLD